MKETLGYDFFMIKDGAPLEFEPAYGQEFAQLYNQKVAKLAWDIAQLLKLLDSKRGANGSASDSRAAGFEAHVKPAIYLAECSYDRKPAREIIEGELKCLGYSVVPDKGLPADETEYGRGPGGPTTKSVAIHQNELAVARCKAAGLKRLIWLPEGTRSDESPQQAFISALHQDPQAQFGADLIVGGIEELKSAIHATLKKIEQPEPRELGSDAKTDKLIYIICDEKDRKACVPLRKLCREWGLQFALPVFEGDASEVRKTNQQLLASCDAVVLYYGAGDEAWKRSIDNELKKAAAYRSRPLRAKVTYLAEPRTSDKEDLIDMEEPGVIDGLGGVAEAAIAKLLKPAIALGAVP
jgi:hypothetical protein